MNMNLFSQTVDLVVNLEGGFQSDPDDTGNWTGGAKGKGELKGTKFGISAKSYPHLDIENITKEEAIEIYRRDYWERIGAPQLRPSLAVLAFDVAVNSGVGTARRMLEQAGLNELRFSSLRLEHYASLVEQFTKYGRGWIRRWAAVANFAASLDTNAPIDRIMLVFNTDNEEVGRFAIPHGADVITRVTNDASRVYTRFEQA